jgi:hypothetical protein
MITPRGAVRDRGAAVAEFLAGKRPLAAQTFDLHEVLLSISRHRENLVLKGGLLLEPTVEGARSRGVSQPPLEPQRAAGAPYLLVARVPRVV